MRSLAAPLSSSVRSAISPLHLPPPSCVRPGTAYVRTAARASGDRHRFKLRAQPFSCERRAAKMPPRKRVSFLMHLASDAFQVKRSHQEEQRELEITPAPSTQLPTEPPHHVETDPEKIRALECEMMMRILRVLVST